MFQKRIDAIREKLANIEKEIKDVEDEERSLQHHIEIQMKPPTRHGAPWTQFEKDLTKENFNTLTDNLSKKLGRTRLSIILHIQAYISEGLR